MANDYEFHPVVEKIKSILSKNNLWFQYFEHEPVRTSEEAAKVRPEYPISQGAKALIVRVKQSESKKFFIMLVVPGDLKFDILKTKNLFSAKDIRFATEEEVSQITGGVKVGGVPPFGNLFDLQVYADKKVIQNDKIIFNAGDRRISIAIKTTDYQKIVSPEIVDIT